MKILIVDESEARRMVVTRTLRQAGYGDHRLIDAGNGGPGLAAVPAEEPDLVLSDGGLPGASGIELLQQQLRAAGDDVRSGSVTSESTDTLREPAAASGALLLVAEPSTADTVAGALGSVLAA